MRATHQFPNTDLLHGLREIVAMQSAQILDIVNEDVLEDFIKTCKLLTKDSTSNWHEAAIVSINIGSAICDDMFFDSPGWPQRKMPMSDRSNTFGDWSANLLAYFHGPKAVRFLHSIGMAAKTRALRERFANDCLLQLPESCSSPQRTRTFQC
jgi:hypothetical protein